MNSIEATDMDPEVLKHFKSIVAIGGRSGPSIVARALQDRLDKICAIVCTTDTGSSSGVCRRLFAVPAPGDIRTTLSTFAALSGNPRWAALMEQRLHCPGSDDLHGMALGNLLICGLTQMKSSFSAAIQEAAALLGLRGKVLPVTAEPADIEAVLSDGTRLRGEYHIRSKAKAPIARLGWAGTPPRPALGVLESIREAELILIGPGNLYTSLLPCLMVKGVKETIRASRAMKIYICNTTTSPGQTEKFTVSMHVAEISDALGEGALDAVLVNEEDVPQASRSAYAEIGVVPILPSKEDIAEIRSRDIKVHLAPLIEGNIRTTPRRLHKVDTIRHSPRKLRVALERLLAELIA